MLNTTTNNSVNFNGSRELILNNKMAKPVQEMLSPTNLKAATDELLQDLNRMVLPKVSLDDDLKKMYYALANKTNKVTSQKLAEEKAQRLFLNV